MYEFEYKDMEFSKDGSLDELIVLDRYAVPTYDNYQTKDTVVAIVDEKKETKLIGEITAIEDDILTIRDRFGDEHKLHKTLALKPLELHPYELWERWAKGACSVEDEFRRQGIEDELRWLFDGFRYSPGGRIQLMNGQEFRTGKKAQLTSFNCFVVPSARPKITSVEQFLEVMRIAYVEANIQRRGGGTGTNISYINTAKGTGLTKEDFIFYLPEDHKDYKELEDAITLDKFSDVTIAKTFDEFSSLIAKNNSHVIEAIDSVNEMFNENAVDMIKQAYKQRSVAINFVALRERNAIVKSVNGRSSGARTWMELFALIARLLQLKEIDCVDFAELYSFVVKLITQGGSRRGAEMIICNADNKKVRKFITRKQEKGFLDGANVSVGIDDTFMEKVIEAKQKVKNNQELNDDLKWTIETWDLIVYSAWKSAEPGIVWLERCNKYSNSWYFSPLKATNPCLHKDTYMVTENGLEKISRMKSKVWNGNSFEQSDSWKTGVKKVIRLMTNGGFEYTVTPDHKFMLSNGEWTEACKTIGQDIKFEIRDKEWNGVDPYNGKVDYKILGFTLGDGIWHKKSNRMRNICITPDLDEEVEEYITSTEGYVFDWVSGKYCCEIPIRTVYADAFKGVIAQRDVPDWVMTLPKKQMADFICGLFSANGTNLKKYSKIQLVSINKEMLAQVQQMLLMFGIKAKLWYHNKEHDVTFSNGTYTCKKSYHLVLSRKSYERYLDKIGFIQTYKNGYEHKNRKDELDYEKVILISEMDEAEVWDFSESVLHRGVTNGAIVHNCGEQPLPENGICNLGHHVLPRYFTREILLDKISDTNDKLYYPEAEHLLEYTLDWNSLARACHTAVRFQDNIIDYTPYFTRETEELQKRERRVGIGTMGLGTLMIQLHLRYGSDEGNKFVDELYKFIAYHTYKASMLLAQERGAFVEYDYHKFRQSGFMQVLLDEFPDLDNLLKITGIRNVTLLTSAPTGSTATYIDNIPMFVEKFGGTSTGVEPYFAFDFYRASRLGEGFMQTMAIAKQYMNEHSIKSTDDLPEWFVTAMDLQPSDHVTVQATIQKWVDSAISKTANCPEEYTVEQIDKLYMLAYELGCKGVTTYRANSREAQVLSTDKDKAKLEQHLEAEKLEQIKLEESVQQPDIIIEDNTDSVVINKRPSRLFGFTEKVKFMSGEKMAKAYVTVNVDEDGEPIEVFVSTNDAALNEFADSIGRLTTQFLRFAKTQSNVDQLVKHLRANKPMSSLSSKIASLIEQTAYGKIKVPTPKKAKRKPIFQKCPDCGELAYDKANCICTKCGSSHCN